jgi:RecB family exonuclease
VNPDTPQPPAEAASIHELLFSAVRRKSLPARFDFLLDRWHQLHYSQVVLRARRAKIINGEHEGFVEPIALGINQKYSPTQIWSASRLETYSNCPFHFFVNSALGLEPRELPMLGLDVRQRGSMLHEILEQTYKQVHDTMNLESVLASLQKESEKVFSNAPRKQGFRPSALWEIEKAQLLEKLEETVTELAKDTDWVPFAFELAFGFDDTQPLLVDLGGEIISIHGVIDRMERNALGQIRIIDYKTGSSHLSIKDLEKGYRLQLPIYAMAARDALDLGFPVDGLYWKILGAEAGSLKLAKCSTDNAKGVEAAIEIVREHLKRVVNGIHSAEFPPKKPEGGCPSYCPASQWCWRYEAGR